jgi:hypothetical protein
MQNDKAQIEIPPTEVVRERLASITTEGRLLRKVLRIARSRDQARTQDTARNESEAVPCK